MALVLLISAHGGFIYRHDRPFSREMGTGTCWSRFTSAETLENQPSGRSGQGGENRA